MEITSIYPRDPLAASAGRLPKVYINGQRRRDLVVTLWERAAAPDFDRVHLQLLRNAQGHAARMDDICDLAPIGSPLRVRTDDGVDDFRGAISSHSSQAGPDGEKVVAHAVHALADLLRPVLGSFVQISRGQPVTLPGNDISFNKRLTGMCSSHVTSLGSRQARLFSAEASSKSWTVADALGYLLATAVPASVQTQGLDELESLAGSIDLGEINIAGMSVLDALVRMAKRGGLAVRAARQGLGLIVYRPGYLGRRRQVRLQRAGEHFSPLGTNLRSADVTFLRRPWRRNVLAVGEAKRYESTFMLLPGWDRALETTRWRDFVRSMSDNWERLCDVYRKWVLNEHGWYCASPWNLQANSLAAIDADDFRLLAPRRLMPCLSTNPNQRSLGVVLEMRLAPDQPWRQWRGAMWVSRDECAVYLGGDGLAGEFFQAAAQGLAQVRVTATIEADARIQSFAQGDAGCGTEVIDLSSRAAWRKVHAGSIFYRDSSLGPPAEWDDTALLVRAAGRRQESSAQGMQARLELGWIDTDYQVGDVIERIEGRELDLQVNQACPAVTTVRHDFLKQTTVLEVQG